MPDGTPEADLRAVIDDWKMRHHLADDDSVLLVAELLAFHLKHGPDREPAGPGGDTIGGGLSWRRRTRTDSQRRKQRRLSGRALLGFGLPVNSAQPVRGPPGPAGLFRVRIPAGHPPEFTLGFACFERNEPVPPAALHGLPLVSLVGQKVLQRSEQERAEATAGRIGSARRTLLEQALEERPSEVRRGFPCEDKSFLTLGERFSEAAFATLTTKRATQAMNGILIWDLPTRLFHWAFTLLLTASIALALVADEGGPLFQWHMLCGVAAASLLALRLVTGFAGSRYARFASLPLAPRKVAHYFGGVLSGKAERFVGHNPGSALAAVAMFLLVGLLVLTGLGVGGEEVQELHGPVAYFLMAVIALHLAGLVAHTLRHGENIAASMVTGRKMGLPEQGLATAHPAWGLAFLLVGGAWVGGLFAAHDARAATTRLPVIGTVISLGERESHGNQQADQRRHRRDHDDD